MLSCLSGVSVEASSSVALGSGTWAWSLEYHSLMNECMN
jgi:hypothetical protein